MERDRPYDRTEEVRRHSSEAKTRERFAVLAQTGRFTIGELCRDFVVVGGKADPVEPEICESCQ